MTLVELGRWWLERKWGVARKADFARYITKHTVLPVNRELCSEWVTVTFSARRIGRPIQTADAWIAATAIYYQVPLITNNSADYEAIRQAIHSFGVSGLGELLIRADML